VVVGASVIVLQTKKLIFRLGEWDCFYLYANDIPTRIVWSRYGLIRDARVILFYFILTCTLLDYDIQYYNTDILLKLVSIIIDYVYYCMWFYFIFGNWNCSFIIILYIINNVNQYEFTYINLFIRLIRPNNIFYGTSTHLNDIMTYNYSAQMVYAHL